MTEVEPAFLEYPAQISAQELRVALGVNAQEGVLASGDLKVVQRAAGSNRSVDVAAGEALVRGDAVSRQGLYACYNDLVKNSDAFSLGGIAAQEANPRIDQIVARVYDASHDTGTSLRLWRLEVIKGTATVGATLANRSGVAALPANALLLADVLVPTDGVIDNTEIRDRRSWARGAYVRKRQESGADYTTASTSFAVIDATNLATRLECTGNPMRVSLRAVLTGSAALSAVFQPRVDGATGVGSEGDQVRIQDSSDFKVVHLTRVLVPAAGSRLFEWWWKTSTGTAALQRGTDYFAEMVVEELLRPSASND
jgi:hypothetical protein